MRLYALLALAASWWGARAQRPIAHDEEAVGAPNLPGLRRKLGAASAATSGAKWTPDHRVYDAPEARSELGALPAPPRACPRAAVVTTINAPTDAIKTAADTPGWCVVVVGDVSTPDEEYAALAAAKESVTYLSLAVPGHRSIGP